MEELPRLAPGSTIGGYRIDAVVGRGGMGIVYRATHVALERPVALKVIAPDLAADADFRERFRRESKTAASIEHPNVVPVYEIGEDRGLPFIAMRYIEGTDLATLIRGGPLEPGRAVRIVAQIARALDAAHAKGLVHRDVKPANVLLTGAEGEEHVYLTDFGLTKISESSGGLTKTGQFLGTIDYLSPEQVEHGDADARSDVYALGCVLYEALTGTVPYPRAHEAAKLWAHVRDAPPHLADAIPDLPLALDDVVRRALAKRPADRYATPGELARAAVAAVETPRPPRLSAAALTTRRSAVVAAGVAGVIAAAISIPVFALGRGGDGGGQGFAKPGDSTVAVIEAATKDVVDVVPVGARPRDIVAASGALWVANLDDRTLSRIDPRAARVVRTISLSTAPTALAPAPDGLWFISTGPKTTVATAGRIDPRYNTISKTVEFAGSPYGGGEGGIAVGEGAVWLVPGGVGRILTLALATGTLSNRLDAGSCCPTRIAVGAGAAWVVDPYADAVTRIDAVSEVVTTIPVARGPTAVAVGEGAVWVALARDNAVAHVDVTTRAVRATIHVGRAPVAIAVGGGSVWVANSRDGTISEIDPRTDRVVDTIAIGESPQGVAYLGGRVWVSLQAGAASRPRRQRDVVRVNAQGDVDSLDPALAYTPLAQATLARATLSWQILYATCAKLVNYPDRAGPRGSRLVPEVAESLPTVTDRGRTYTFTIRRGARFSPPSKQTVTAKSFKFAVERSLSPELNGPASLSSVTTGSGARATVDDIVGADSYAARAAKHVAGVVAKGNKLRITLRQAAPDFLDRLAQPFFCAVPTDTPVEAGAVQTVPSAGPYYVAEYRPHQLVVLRRNPRYTGSRPHRLREIRITLGVGHDESVREIEAGRADYALDGVPSDAVARLRRRYGAGSAAAKAGEQRYFVNPTLELHFVALNTSRPPFSDVTLRRAANYAIDRRALVRLVSAVFTAEPTDQYLPPGMRGFRDARVYPERADLSAARALMRGRSVRTVLYACAILCVEPARVVKENLEAIGIHVDIQEFSIPALRDRLGTRDEPYDITLTAWNADYPDPAEFLDPLFNGERIRAKDNANVARLDDPGYNSRLERAAKLSGSRRFRAYGALDVNLARDAAPLVALGVPTRQDFFSARIGCQVYQPVYGIDLAALCIRG